MSSLGETVARMSTSPQQIKSLAIEKIKQILGEKGFIEHKDEMTPFLTEWRGFYTGDAQLVAFPENVKMVSDITKVCAEAGISIVPQGGNTSMCGGAVPSSEGNAIVLSMSKMNKILSIDTTNYTMTVEAGCILQNLQEAAKAEEDHQDGRHSEEAKETTTTTISGSGSGRGGGRRWQWRRRRSTTSQPAEDAARAASTKAARRYSKRSNHNGGRGEWRSGVR